MNNIESKSTHLEDQENSDCEGIGRDSLEDRGNRLDILEGNASSQHGKLMRAKSDKGEGKE